MTNEFIPVAAITVVCYLAAELIKKTPLDNKWIPILCGILGGVLGFGCFRFAWGAIPAQDPLTALAIGIVSGFASTGVNQVGKQLIYKKEVESQ